MAKQKLKREKKINHLQNAKPNSNILNFLIDGRFKKVVGLILFFIAIFLSVSFYSYFLTWKPDQDKVFNEPNLWNFIWNNSVIVSNQAGKLGAYFSHQLIYNGLGLASLFLIPLFAILGLNLLLKKRILSSLKVIFYCTLFSILLSPILSYFFSTKKYSFSFGGSLGNSIVTFLSNSAGELGTLFIMIGLLLIFAILFFNPIIQLPVWSNLSTFLFSSNMTKVTTSEPDTIEGILPIPEPLQEEENKTDPASTDISFTEEENDEEQVIHITETPTIEISLENDIKTKSTRIQEKEDELKLEVVEVENNPAENQPNKGTVATDEPYDPSLELRDYKFPTIDLLEQRSVEGISIDKAELEQNKNQIITTLKSFGIAISKISATVGPTVTLYEIVPAEGVRISKIRNLEDDIALSLSALGIRIIAPIPGKGTIGIEVPNLKKQIVSMRALISSDKFLHNDFSLPIAIGKKIDNENYIVDLAKMPHLLMAGATGQGKSVGINTILVSLLYKKHPSQLKFVMVDPKKVELSIYRMIEKHFLAKLPNEEEAIITDTKKVINTLNALCIEMDNRYDLLKNAGVRNIKEYNAKFIQRKLNPQKGHKFLPFIVLVVDEFADLIMTAGKEVEMPIARIAQLARAVGIHLIIATQRPSVNVI
ncbi:MAG TPA: DNA translocase FtsK 4TM domain-containing protein, partial [Chitinophagaceae bacterium]|nr:DNA translocase FtsK 4TM domain-containing protein [Chitinophagaceae bacterium]